MTKCCIRKVLGKRQIDEKMNTILASTEAAINSCPLTQDDGAEALTPAHFLHGGRLTTIPTGPEPTSTRSLTKEFRLKQQVAEDFCKGWTKEYLLELQTYHQLDNHAAAKAMLRRGRHSAGGATTPHVGKGASPGVATREGRKGEDSHSPHPGRRVSGLPSPAGHAPGG
jgi:hypothetical protein